MITRVYAVRDMKIGTYMRPFHETHEVQAIRALKVAVNDNQSQLCHYANEYQMFQLATFDDETGRFEQFEHPQFVANLGELKELNKAIDKIEETL